MVAPECVDWADLLSNRGHVLFPNVLAVHALNVGAALVKATKPAEAERLLARAQVVKGAIQHAMWVQDPQQCVDTSHRQAQRQAAVVMRRRPFFLPWINLFETDDRFDATGNLLAILCGVANDDQTNKILDHIENVGLDKPFPVRVLHPPILPGDKEWREYYRVFNLNLPHQYHNGGIWAWVGGVYVAALVRAGRQARAAQVLEALAASLRPGRKAEWECNEWLHGETGRAMGAPYQAWSAGMFIYAEHAVNTKTTPGF
jgi:glycogen debranching enzyme